MKLLALALFTCLATARGSPPEPEERRVLMDELREIHELIPYERILLTMMRYTAKDPRVQAPLLRHAFLESQSLFAGLLNSTEFRKLADFLESGGFEVYAHVDCARSLIASTFSSMGEPRLPAKLESRSTDGGVQGIQGFEGLEGLAREVKTMVPFEKIEAVRRMKAETVPAYARFYRLTRSEEFSRLVKELRASEPFRRLAECWKSLGLDIDTVVDIICSINGLETC